MSQSPIQIDKNFDTGIITSYDDLPLKPYLKTSIQNSNLNPIPPIHCHLLPAMLSLKNILLSSPAATGKTSLLSIALHQLLVTKYNNLQIIIIEQLEHLVQETFTNLENFCPSPKIKYCVCDKSTPVKADYKPFSNCQVAILTVYKCLELLKRSHRTYTSVKLIVLDAINPKYKRSLPMLNLLKEKIPNATFWVLSGKMKQDDEEFHFYLNYLRNPCVLIVKKNHSDVQSLSHCFTVVQGVEEKVFYLRKILNLNREYQKIVFFGDRTDSRVIINGIKEFSPVLLDCDEDRARVMMEFEKKMIQVLVVPARQFFSRQIKSKSCLYVVIFDLPDVELYETLSRRGGCSTNDRVFLFVQGNDAVERVAEISDFYKIRINVWPNNNDD